MQQPSLYQANRQQLLMMGATIFASITAAVIVSVVIIMSLMRGEIASALTSNVQNSSPTSQVANSCAASPEDTAPVEASPVSSEASDVTQTTGALMTSMYVPSSNNSFNSTNINTTNTTNTTNTEVHNKTVTNDSFNDNSKTTNVKIEDSFNPVVIKDNKVNVDINSHNNTAVNSGNTVKNTVNNTTTNVNSNNTTIASNNNNPVNSNNEQHILSDNQILAVLPL